MARRIRPLSISAVLGLAVLGLSGCGLTDGPVAYELEEITLAAEDDANSFSPTAVDVVLVFDEAVVNRLQGLTAANWFAARDQINRDFPDGLFVRSWEVVPDTVQTPWILGDEALENAEGDDAIAGFIFADLLSPGDHRARLDRGSGLRITVGRDDFALTPYEADS